MPMANAQLRSGRLPRGIVRLRAMFSGSPLFARIAWGIVIGFLLLHVISGSYQAHQSLVNQATQLVLSIAERARVIDGLTADRADRTDAFEKISDASFSISLAAQPARLPEGERAWHSEALVRERAKIGLGELGFNPDDVIFSFIFKRGEPRLVLSLPASTVATDDWLVVSASARPARWQRHAAGLIWTTLLALMILGLVLWATRRFTRFLPAFVSAAERVGSMAGTEYLPEAGPRELRRLGVAFNNMQDKIQAHEQERRTMLGAVSHDLRTLVTRLSLRLEDAHALPARDKVRDDLESMTRIVDEALAFSRDESSDEALVKLEFLSLVQTVIDSRNEALTVVGRADGVAGDDVVEGVLGAGDPVYIQGQPVGLKRALLNIVDNAVIYGGSVTVRLWVQAQSVIVEVADAGRGIAPADQQAVLRPYVRLEESRNRATGGTGLGLAIANKVISRHRGTLKFVTAEDGAEVGKGRSRFAVRIELPLSAG